jgi:hypothetical protein
MSQQQKTNAETRFGLAFSEFDITASTGCTSDYIVVVSGGVAST